METISDTSVSDIDIEHAEAQIAEYQREITYRKECVVCAELFLQSYLKKQEGKRLPTKKIVIKKPMQAVPFDIIQEKSRTTIKVDDEDVHIKGGLTAVAYAEALIDYWSSNGYRSSPEDRHALHNNYQDSI